MKKNLFLFLVFFAFAQIAFSQNNNSANNSQPYLFGSTRTGKTVRPQSYSFGGKTEPEQQRRTALSAQDEAKTQSPRPQTYVYSNGVVTYRSNQPPTEVFAAKSKNSAGVSKSGSANSTVSESNITRPRASTNEPKRTVENSAPVNSFALERRVFELINQQRAAIGLPVLIWSDEVAGVARVHSEDMAKLNFFSHEGTDGSVVSNRADQAGVKKWRAIGENIAYNRGFDDPVAFAVERWMKSPAHRENILNGSWIESGIGVAVTADGTYYFTEVFLKRR